jgi:hypothetical protein
MESPDVILVERQHVQSPQQGESSLCLSCGLCCNGTLFDTVPLAPYDDTASLHAAGITDELADGVRRFQQPCSCHDGEECRVYAYRPAACRNYACDLLKRVRAGTIDDAEARRIIDKVIRLDRSLVAAAREIEPGGDSTWKSRRTRLKQLTERLEQVTDGETRQKIGGVMVQMVAEDRYIARNFGETIASGGAAQPEA